MHPDFLDLISAFNAERVEFLGIGAHALAAHGLPRATGDFDLWVGTADQNPQRVHRALTSFTGAEIAFSAEEFREPDQIFQLGVEPVRIEILTSISGDIDFEDAYARRIDLTISDVHFPVLSREDLIATKLATARPQDLADVARLKSAVGGKSD